MYEQRSIFDLSFQQPDIEVHEASRRVRSPYKELQRAPLTFPTVVRSRLSPLDVTVLPYFKPHRVANLSAKTMIAEASRQFYSELEEIFRAHSGQKVLIVHEKDPAGNHDQKELKPDIYLGIVKDSVDSILAASGDAVFPVARYVASQACLMAFDRKEGELKEAVVFGKNANTIWLFNLVFSNGRHALDFFFGEHEVEQWFKRWDGFLPYLHGDIVKRLNAPLFTANCELDYV